MKQPPKMVSTKDAMYLSDILTMEMSIIKKSCHYDTLIQDEDIRKLNQQIEKELKAQYNSLLEVLKNGK